jgi:very-short-patch-repair endonuclease
LARWSPSRTLVRVSDPITTTLAESQHGVVARRQLRDAGLSPGAIRALERSPHWAVVTSEVFRRVGAPRSPEQLVTVAVLDAGPGAVLTDLSGAAWWGLTGCSLEPVHALRCGAPSRRVSELAVVTRVRRLPSRWTTELRGVPVVRPELLALRLFAVCREERAERLVERMWSMRLLSGGSIAIFLDDLGERGRNGTRGLRDYLAARGPGYTPPASGLEARAMQLFRDVGVDLRRQVDSGGELWVGRVDFRHPTLPLIVEIQSEAYHSALLDREADRRRREALEAAGFVVLELTDEQVWSRPWEVGPVLLAALRRLTAAT